MHISDFRVILEPGAPTIGLRVHTETSWTATALVRAVEVNGGRHGLRIEGRHDLLRPENTPHLGLQVEDFTSHGAEVATWVSGVKGVTLVRLSATTSAGDAVVIQHSHAVTVTESSIRRAGGHGLVIQYSSACSVQSSGAASCGGAGLVIGGGDPRRQAASGFLLKDNHTEANGGSGIICDPTVAGREGIPVSVDGRIVGNVSRHNADHGIVITCGADIEVAENHCDSNTKDGIAVSSSDVTVSNNVAIANGWSGIAFYGGRDRPRYGGHVATRNRLEGNRRPGIHSARPGLVTGEHPDSVR